MPTTQTDLAKLTKGRSDPLLNFKWVTEEFLFGLPGSYLESVDLPFNNLSVRQGIYNGGSFTYYPGTNNISSVSMTFYEDSEGSTVQWLEGWKAKVFDSKTGLRKLPSNYKRVVQVHLLDTEGEKVITAVLEGLFPDATQNIQLSYNESGRITISQTFSCDNGSFKFLKPSALYSFT